MRRSVAAVWRGAAAVMDLPPDNPRGWGSTAQTWRARTRRTICWVGRLRFRCIIGGWGCGCSQPKSVCSERVEVEAVLSHRNTVLKPVHSSMPARRCVHASFHVVVSWLSSVDCCTCVVIVCGAFRTKKLCADDYLCYTEKAVNAWHRRGRHKTGNTYDDYLCAGRRARCEMSNCVTLRR